MTIKKPELHIINNTHQQDTMAELKRLLDQKQMTQADLAMALKRDKTTINRWSSNSRDITSDNAIKISEVLGCHPQDVLFTRKQTILKFYINNDCIVKNYSKEEQHPILLPYDYYKPNVKAIEFVAPGTENHKKIYLFDVPNQANKFSSISINKVCFVTPSKKWKRKTGSNNDTLGIVKTNDDGTLKIINPITRKPVNKNCEKFNAEDIDICVPEKATYYPELL